MESVKNIEGIDNTLEETKSNLDRFLERVEKILPDSKKAKILTTSFACTVLSLFAMSDAEAQTYSNFPQRGGMYMAGTNVAGVPGYAIGVPSKETKAQETVRKIGQTAEAGQQ